MSPDTVSVGETLRPPRGSTTELPPLAGEPAATNIDLLLYRINIDSGRNDVRRAEFAHAALDHEIAFSANVHGGRADHYADTSRLHDEAHARIEEAKLAQVEVEGDAPRFARGNRHALEARKLLHGPRAARDGIVDVKLHDFLSRQRPDVAHIDCDLNDIVHRRRVRVDY